jgi:CubicO group peptidase (beta-lactamase class C family)
MAQSKEQQKVDSVFQLVKKQFNAKQADSLYKLAGQDLKRDLIIEAFRNICNFQLFPLGKIQQASLVSFQNNKIAMYKLTFSTSNVLQLLMSLDDNDKLQLFLFQPYKEPVGTKPAMAPATNQLKTDLDRKVDGPARAYIQKANTVGLSIGIINDGSISTYGYGETTRGNGKIPNVDNIFEIGSLTKTFTATLLAYYVDEGRVKLSDPIIQYLPDSVSANPALDGITLEMLSNHTSGLSRLPEDFATHAKDATNPYKDYNEDMIFSYLKHCKLAGKPGETYLYSNFAVGLLGNILEHVSAENYQQMVSQMITTPLNMTATAQHPSRIIRSRVTTVYNEDGLETPHWDWDALAPAGALNSSLNDLLLFAKANMAKPTTRLTKALTLTHQITYNKAPKVGLGWHIITVNNIDYFFHDGGTGGSSTFFAFNIEKQTAVIILSNCAESTYATGVDILKQLQ